MFGSYFHVDSRNRRSIGDFDLYRSDVYERIDLFPSTYLLGTETEREVIVSEMCEGLSLGASEDGQIFRCRFRYLWIVE